jgi:hypothetical protein
MNQVWTKAERDYVLNNACRMRDADIAAALSRLTGRLVTLHAVRHIRQRGGTSKRMGRGICEVTRQQASPAVGLCMKGE